MSKETPVVNRRIAAAVLSSSGGHAKPYADSAPLDVKPIELADPRPGEVLVRIDAAGICHSDLSVVNGDRPRPMPMALGHEAAATVLALGDPEEPGLAVGDRCVLVFLPSCGQCEECLSGEGYLCSVGAAANGKGELLRGGSRLSCDGETIHHHLGCSAFATQAVVDRRSLVKIDSDISPETAALFGCAVLTGVGAVMNTAQVRPGESVTIYGLGGVGLSALLGALAAGAQPVHAIDPSPAKRALALELGAASASAPGEDEAAMGSDVVIETVGKAAVLAAAYNSARRGGPNCRLRLGQRPCRPSRSRHRCPLRLRLRPERWPRPPPVRAPGHAWQARDRWRGPAEHRRRVRQAGPRGQRRPDRRS